ncbi:Eco57I restriction-modification methylase domain-containing protein [Haloarcula sp. AONF1]
MTEFSEELENKVRSKLDNEIITHDELRDGFVQAIRTFLDEQNDVYGVPKMERQTGGGGYYDLKIGNVYFEFKKPGIGIEKGIEEAKEYLDSEDGEFFITDGYDIAHVDSNKNIVLNEPLLDGAPHLRLFLASEGKLRPNELIELAGSKSSIGQRHLRVFWEEFQKYKDDDNTPEVDNAFELWKRVFAESANLTNDARRGVRKDAKAAGIDIYKGEEEEYLFAIQTHFATLLKLLAAKTVNVDISSHQNPTSAESFTQLSDEPEIEGIVDHDLFDWFVHPATESKESSERLSTVIRSLVRIIESLNLSGMKVDVFRQLYQDSFDSEVRKAMGEFYTNKQLVNETLDKTGYNGEEILDKKFVDPACGSGTFIIEAISRFRSEAKNKGWSDDRIINEVENKIQGIDLHPFAVMMARVNYMLALNGVLSGRSIDIPVYWADSLAQFSRSMTPTAANTITTEAAPFEDPIELPDPEEVSPDEVFQIVDKAFEGQDWSEDRFVEEFDDEIALKYETTLRNLHRLFRKNENTMWVPAVRNVLAVDQLRDEVDYVIGNPPWVRAGNVEENLRERLKNEFDFYSSPWDHNLSNVRNSSRERDYSITFVESGLDFLKDGDGDTSPGHLGFVITSNVTRALYGGPMRETLIEETTLLQLTDLSFSPRKLFEGADCAPLLISFKNETPDNLEYEIDIEVQNRSGEIRKWATSANELPIHTDDAASPWIIAPSKAAEGIRKMQEKDVLLGDKYESSIGIKTAKNAAFYVTEISPTDSPDEHIIMNENDDRTRIENDLIHPLIGGDGIDAWEFQHDRWVLWTHDDNGDPLDTLPSKASSYFESWKSDLESRRDYTVTSQMDRGAPYWVIGNVSGRQTNSKVAWQKIAKTVETVYLPSKVDTEVGERTLIVTSNVNFLATPNDDVAAGLTGLLNSTPSKVFTGSYVNRTGAKYCAYFNWTIGLIPLPDNITDISGIARKVQKGDQSEDELDEEVASLYEITDEQLEEMKEYDQFFNL